MCDPTATIYEIRNNNRFASTKPPQIIIELKTIGPDLGASSGGWGEIGAALSGLRGERPPSYHAFKLKNMNIC